MKLLNGIYSFEKQRLDILDYAFFRNLQSDVLRWPIILIKDIVLLDLTDTGCLRAWQQTYMYMLSSNWPSFTPIRLKLLPETISTYCQLVFINKNHNWKMKQNTISIQENWDYTNYCTALHYTTLHYSNLWRKQCTIKLCRPQISHFAFWRITGNLFAQLLYAIRRVYMAD